MLNLFFCIFFLCHVLLDFQTRTNILSATYSQFRGCCTAARLVIAIILSATYSRSSRRYFIIFLVIAIILSATYSRLMRIVGVAVLVIAIILSATYSPSRIMELVSTGWYSSGTCETRSILSRTSPLPVISAFSFVLLPRQVLQCFRPTPPLWRLATVSF